MDKLDMFFTTQCIPTAIIIYLISYFIMYEYTREKKNLWVHFCGIIMYAAAFLLIGKGMENIYYKTQLDLLIIYIILCILEGIVSYCINYSEVCLFEKDLALSNKLSLLAAMIVCTVCINSLFLLYVS